MMQLHKSEPIFVGRKDELKRFGEVLASPKGQAVLVVGPQGMGKTLLVNRMARMAQDHPSLKCGTVRYEVTKTDDVATTMALMIDHAFEAANVGEKFLSGSGDQWRALFKAIGVVPVVGKAAETIGELALSLKRDPAKDTRTQFIERLRLVSEKMPDDGRAIFVIDPEKYMKDDSHDAWRLVLRDLPDRIIFLFAQRPDDVLARSPEFNALSNVARIPDGPLDVLNEHEVDDLVQAWAAEKPRRARKEAGPTPLVQARAADLPSRARKEAEEAPEPEAPPEKHTLTVAARSTKPLSADVQSHQYRARKEAASALARYNGHPYAVAAALGLLADGAAIADLRADPTPTGVAKEQWRRLCDEHKENAIRLFEAYAILEVAVPDAVVETVSGVDGSVRTSLVANAFVAGLLRPEPDGTRIYHSLLADHILALVSESAAKAYHTRAMGVYRRRLTADVKPDALAAVRLPEHVLAVEGPKAFVDSLANECTQPLVNLGLFDAALAMSRRALEKYVAPGGTEEAIIAGNLGTILYARGGLNEPEKMYRQSLKIDEKHGRLEGMAITYGNLGIISKTRGELDEAEKMYLKALEIEKKLGRLEGMARQYGNLGNISRTRGDLDEAEKMYHKSLEIHENLGRLDGMANQYRNLGLVHLTRGDLDEAEKMSRKALGINEKLGRPDGMAADFGSLGLIYETRGDLGEAERMHRKSLEIHERLGRLQGIAKDYGNLGVIFKTRGDLDEAEKMYRRVLEIDEKIGRLESVGTAYGNLGIIFAKRGDLDGAEKMYRKSLAIDEKLGRLEGMANQCGNLGNLFQLRGDLDAAERMHRKSLEIEKQLGRLEGMAAEFGSLGNVLFAGGKLDEAERMYLNAKEIDEKLGRIEGLALTYGNLGFVFKTRGDLDEARKLWTKARDIYAKIGMSHMVQKVQSDLDGLPDVGKDRP